MEKQHGVVVAQTGHGLEHLDRLIDTTAWIASRLAWSLRRRGISGTALRAGRQIARWVGAPERKRDPDAVYREWLRHEGSERSACRRARNVLERLPARPLVSLVAAVREGDDLSPTLASLRAQVYPSWEIGRASC